ncbi:unnamed protein product, partial [Ascophyllum nodosum]
VWTTAVTGPTSTPTLMYSGRPQTTHESVDCCSLLTVTVSGEARLTACRVLYR